MIAEGYREAAVRHGKAQARLRTDQIVLRLEPFTRILQEIGSKLKVDLSP